MYITETHGCRAGKAAASAFKSASMHIPCILQLLISQAKSYSKSSNLLMQKGQLFSLQFRSSMLKCKHVSPHSTLLFLHSSLVYQDQLIEWQGIIYKGTGQDRVMETLYMGFARWESTPDWMQTIGNTRTESRVQDPQRSSRLFRWMGSFAWKFCKPAACLVPWPGALVPLRAFTLT